MGRPRTVTLALAALLAASIGGCGSSGSRGASTSSPTTSGPATRTVTHTVTAAHSSAPPPASSSTGGSPAPSVRTGPSPVSVCRAAGVKLTYLGGQGATGHGLLGFAMQNTGHVACRTIGYPGIQFVASDGTALPTHDARTTTDFFGTTRYAALTLAPGRSASFRLGVSHGSASPRRCVTAAAVQVIAPNDTSTVRIQIPGGVYECGGTVTVSPMQPGDSAYH